MASFKKVVGKIRKNFIISGSKSSSSSRKILLLSLILLSSHAFALPGDFLNPWIGEEKRRMFGYRNALSRDLAKANDAAIKDSSGLIFRMDRKGNLAFDPLYGNWKIRTFTRSDVLFHMAEAETFYRSGLYEEALSIWKAASRLFLLKNLVEHERKAASEAVRAMNRFQNDHVFYETIHEKINSIVLFDDKAGRTHVFGDKTALHVILPGAWSYMRPAGKFSYKHEALYLRHADHELTIVWENPRGIFDYGNPLENYIYFWDNRQHLDERIKRMNAFQRNRIEVSRCGGGRSFTEKQFACGAFAASFNNLPFYQIFFLKEKKGVYMIYKNPDPVDSMNVVKFITENTSL